MQKEELLKALKNSEIQSKIEKFGGIQSNSLPNMPKMFNNIKNSIVNNAKSVAQGNPLKISDEEAKNRLNICKTCPFFNSLNERCTKCGCYMSVKTYLRAEKCPVGKW